MSNIIDLDRERVTSLGPSMSETGERLLSALAAARDALNGAEVHIIVARMGTAPSRASIERSRDRVEACVSAVMAALDDLRDASVWGRP